MYGSLDISTSGLVAQRTRMTVIAGNIANRDALLNADGEYDPYRRRFVVMSPGDGTGRSEGVHVASIEQDQGPLIKKLEPDSPFADKDGYVHYPNVNSVVEQMNMMEAMRAYEANVTAAEATKSMMSVALRLLG
jgi:flagellar basal-body rod protein FlgC